jgi:acetolactate synthase-1/2/3 large subunit
MQAYGVSHVFFVPTMMLPAMAAMEDMGITRVVTHGEKAAAYMADGYARASAAAGHLPGDRTSGPPTWPPAFATPTWPARRSSP